MTESTTAAVQPFAEAVNSRVARLEALAADGGFGGAIDLITTALPNGGEAYAFGTGHSEAFAMEIAGRAGGLVQTKKVALRDLALVGDVPISELKGISLERDLDVADQLFEIEEVGPQDVVLIAYSSGDPVIAVTSLANTMEAERRHASGKLLKDIADVTIDNLAPYGDAAITIGADVAAGAVFSIAMAFIAPRSLPSVSLNASCRPVDPHPSSSPPTSRAATSTTSNSRPGTASPASPDLARPPDPPKEREATWTHTPNRLFGRPVSAPPKARRWTVWKMSWSVRRNNPTATSPLNSIDVYEAEVPKTTCPRPQTSPSATRSSRERTSGGAGRWTRLTWCCPCTASTGDFATVSCPHYLRLLSRRQRAVRPLGPCALGRRSGR